MKRNIDILKKHFTSLDSIIHTELKNRIQEKERLIEKENDCQKRFKLYEYRTCYKGAL